MKIYLKDWELKYCFTKFFVDFGHDICQNISRSMVWRGKRDVIWLVVKNLCLKRNYTIHIDIKCFRIYGHITTLTTRFYELQDNWHLQLSRRLARRIWGFFILLRFSLYWESHIGFILTRAFSIMIFWPLIPLRRNYL